MRLTRLIASGFRNLEPFDLATDAPFVVLHGPNAQGKTNALEAVYVLCTLRPLRGKRKELIRWGADEATISGWVRTPQLERRYRVDLTSAARTVELDGNKVSDLNEYFADIRCICFTPQDGRIVSGEPSWRRRWLDRAAFTAFPAHLDTAREFRRALAQRGALLKEPVPDRAVLDALDVQVARTGAALVHRRVALLKALEPHVRAVHRDLAGGTGEVRLTYRTAATGDSVAERTESLLIALSEARPNELRRRMNLVGPQTDDVKIALDDHSARAFGSRGQVRSLVLSLKIAELVAAHARGEVPLFLIDDVSSELDKARTGRLVGLLADLKAQVWATTTDPEHMDALPRSETLRIAVDRGTLAIEDPD